MIHKPGSQMSQEIWLPPKQATMLVSPRQIAEISLCTIPLQCCVDIDAILCIIILHYITSAFKHIKCLDVF